MAHCVASTFEVDLPTRSEMHMAVDVAVLLADECLLQVPTSGTVRFVNRLFFFLVNSIFQHEDLACLGSMQSSACSTSTQWRIQGGGGVPGVGTPPSKLNMK